MSKDKPSLGTGLDSLLGERPEAGTPGVGEIAIEDLSPGQYQPRKKMYKSTLEELAQSIKEQGILQPLVVRRQASGRFEIVVGERRWRAAQIAGLATVPAIVRDLNNDETAKIALIENLQREDLNALDQARGLQRLQQEFNLSQEALGRAVGKSRSAVTNLLRLLNLLPEVQALLEEGSIEMGHARALLAADPANQLGLAKEVVKKSLSVRQTEVLVGGKKQSGPNNKGAQPKDPNTKKLEKDLSESLGAQVSIKHNKKGKGSLTINFKSLDALQGVLERIKK
tara:strand:- start:55 stop:903 length:849 start_codon:yes stop_codon:yes gene_type:complete